MEENNNIEETNEIDVENQAQATATNHQQSLVKDSFSTIERLEVEMAEIVSEFKSLVTV